MLINEYTPCRISECYMVGTDGVEISNLNGTIFLNGAGSIVWGLLDGKHTIKTIVQYLSNELNIGDYKTVHEEVISLLKVLQQKKFIIANWDPLYKFELNQEL